MLIYVPATDVVIDPCNISKLIDLSKVIQIELHWVSFGNYDQTVWMNLSLLISMAINLTSLIISDLLYTFREIMNTEYLLSLIPPTIKHIDLSINNLDQLQAIIEKCSNLIWVNVAFNRKCTRRHFVAWCNECTSNSSYRKYARRVSVWLGVKQNNEPYRMETRRKRIKLSND